MESGIHNTSEIGRLRKVMLHRPGGELENLMPEYLERLLFDDIPYLREAQREHDAFAECLRSQGVEVVYLTDLVVQSLTDGQVREELIREFLEESGVRDDRTRQSLEDFFTALPDKEMVAAMMAGVRKSQLRSASARLGDYLSAAGDDYPFAVDPLPNLYFTRDPFATIGTGVSIHKMHTATRNRETLFGKFIFEHHPEYRTAPRWYDRGETSSLEGGDILILSPRVLAVGISQRTQEDSIDQLAETVLSQSKTFRKLLAPGHGIHHGGPGQVHRPSQHPPADHRVRHGTGREPPHEDPPGGRQTGGHPERTPGAGQGDPDPLRPGQRDRRRPGAVERRQQHPGHRPR